MSSWQQIAHRYPFDTPDTVPLSKQALLQGYELLEKYFQPETSLVGLAYIRLLCERNKGEFYTPDWLVDYCVQLCCAEGLPATALDPACGTGNFLVGLIRAARKRLPDPRAVLAFAKQGLHGYDIDGRAVQLARLSMVLELAPELRQCPDEVDSLIENLNSHIALADTLAGVQPVRPFDLVIGNPPYVSFGSRNQPKVPDSWSRFLRQSYPAAAEYKIRTHSLFQERSFQLCADGGSIVLLVPDAFLNGAYYKMLRRHLLQSGEIVSLTELPESTFSDAVVGKWCVAHYRKQEQRGAVELRRMNGPGDWHSYQVSTSELTSADKYRFQLVFNDLEKRILTEFSSYPMLSTVARGHTGIRARAGQKSIIAGKCQGPTWRRGLTSGSAVTAFSITWSGDWLNIDPALLFAGGFNPDIIEHPKLLVRQTADRIICAIDTDGYYHLNNLHSFAGRVECRLSEEALLILSALMNSSLWLYVYQLRTRERQRALAQIDIETLEAMPLPVKPLSKLDEIAGMMRGVSASNLKHSQSELDRLVFQAYGLSDDIERFIEEQLRIYGYGYERAPVATSRRT